MIQILDSNEKYCMFDNISELKEYIEIRHASEGGFDWISEIKDDAGNYYGCSWNLEIVKI